MLQMFHNTHDLLVRVALHQLEDRAHLASTQDPEEEEDLNLLPNKHTKQLVKLHN